MGLCFYGLVLVQPDTELASVIASSLMSAFQSPITYLIAALLGGASLLGMAVLSRGEQHTRSLEEVTRELDALATQYPEGLRGSTLERAREIVESEPILRPCWDEFIESLTTYRGVPHRSAAAEVFFRDEALLDTVEFSVKGASLRWRFLEQLPGLMTGLGMLGTFGGIALGLGQLGGIGGAEASSAEIVSSIGGVVVGLASAFWTSIFGLLLALGFSATHNQREGTLLQRLSCFREALERLVPRLTPEKILRDQHETLVESHESQRELLDLQRRQTLLLESQGTKRGPEGATPDHGEKTNAHLASLIELNRQQLQAMEEQPQDEVEAPQWSQWIDLGQQQLDVLLSMREESEESRSQLQTIASDLADSLGQQLQSSLEEALGPQIERLLGMVEGQITQAAQVSVDGTRRFTEEMVSHLNRSMGDSFEGMATAVTGFTSGFGATAEQLSGLLADMNQALVLQRDVMHESLVAASSMHQKTESMFERWSAREEGLLSSYHDASTRFVEAFEASAHVAEDLSKMSDDFDIRREAIDKLLKVAREVQNQTKTAAETMTQTMDQSTHLFSGAANSLRHISTDTMGWVENTTQAIEQFGSGISVALKDSLITYDTSLSQAVRSLSTAVHELEDLTFSIAEQHAVAG